MFVQPGIQVNPVIDTTPPETDMGHIQLYQERDANTQVFGSLFLGQTPHRRQRKQRRTSFMHGGYL